MPMKHEETHNDSGFFLKKKIKNVGRSLQNTHSVMVAAEPRVEKW